MIAKNKILITGLFGRTGIYFLRELRRSFDAGCLDFEIHCIVRRKELINHPDAMAIGIIFHVGDICNEKFLKSCFDNIDIVFHITGIHFSEKMVSASVDAGVKKLLLVHTTGLYSKYKAAGENYRKIESNIKNYIANKDVSLTILRPTMIYGSIEDKNMIVFIKLVDKFRIIPLVSGGKFKLQPVNAEDLGIAYFQCLQNLDTIKDKEYILSGRDEIYLSDMLKLISKYLKKKTFFVYFPYSFAYFIALLVYIFSFKKNRLLRKSSAACRTTHFQF